MSDTGPVVLWLLLGPVQALTNLGSEFACGQFWFRASYQSNVWVRILSILSPDLDLTILCPSQDFIYSPVVPDNNNKGEGSNKHKS